MVSGVSVSECALYELLPTCLTNDFVVCSAHGEATLTTGALLRALKSKLEGVCEFELCEV